MKKIIAALTAVLMMTIFFAGCNDPLSKQNVAAGTTSAATEVTENTNATVDSNKTYEDNLKGLEELFVDKGYMTIAEDKSNVTEMDASLIGAKEGNRYKANYNNAEVLIELYAFDADNLEDAAKDVINSVKEKGQFQIMNLDPVNAYLSDNGKYLMVYTDKSNPEKDSDNDKRKQEVIETFKAFPNHK